MTAIISYTCQCGVIYDNLILFMPSHCLASGFMWCLLSRKQSNLVSHIPHHVVLGSGTVCGNHWLNSRVNSLLSLSQNIIQGTKLLNVTDLCKKFHPLHVTIIVLLLVCMCVASARPVSKVLELHNLICIQRACHVVMILSCYVTLSSCSPVLHVTRQNH